MVFGVELEDVGSKDNKFGVREEGFPGLALSVSTPVAEGVGQDVGLVVVELAQNEWKLGEVGFTYTLYFAHSVIEDESSPGAST